MFSTAGIVYGIGFEPAPSVIASGIGESIWAASYSLLSVLSRITAQPAVLITSTFRPCLLEAHGMRHDDGRGARDRDETDFEILLLRRAGLRKYLGRRVEREKLRERGKRR